MSKVKAIKLFNTKSMSRKEWLEARKNGIGGSDAASIAGLNKYKSPLQVYMDKTEPVGDVTDEPISEAAEWGNLHEDTIRRKFRSNHPELRVQRSYIMWQSVEHPFMLANVDGLIFHPQKGWGILEVKTSSEWRSNEWGEEEIIEEYLIQMQHYLATMELNWGYFAVLIGGNKYREFYVERDEELVQSLIQIEKDFWENNVLGNHPPEPDGSDSSGAILQQLYPASEALPTEEILELDDSTIELINELDQIKQTEKDLKKRKVEIEQKLQKMLGNHQVAAVEERKITWKPARAFSEQELQKAKPELYSEFAVTVLDKPRFKKAYPKMYDDFMIETEKRSLTVKEEISLYAC